MPRRPDMPPLRRSELREDPVAQFDAWYERALAEALLPEAITLATVDADGPSRRPHGPAQGLRPGRASLLHQLPLGQGRPAREASGYAAVVIYWRELDRQVRARGPSQRLPAEDSDAYFATRPRDSQLGAWASPQS